MYSANDWRCYTLLHADKVGKAGLTSSSDSRSDRVGKWEWPGGNNSKAYNDWYYSHHKDKWRQYYLNKKKNGGSRRARLVNDIKTAIKGDADMNSDSKARNIRGSIMYDAWNAVDNHDPDRFKDYNRATSKLSQNLYVADRAGRHAMEAFRPRTYTSQDAAEYPEQQTPSRGASRRRQTR